MRTDDRFGAGDRISGAQLVEKRSIDEQRVAVANP